MNKSILLKAFKIALGSSIAVLLADCIGLEYATTAGVVTLLTIRNTKKDTIALSVKRLLSFMLTILLVVPVLVWIPNPNIGFGIFMMVLVAVSYLLHWEDSISINAVIGMHIFIIEAQITSLLVFNELGLVVIGTAVAILVNNLYMLDNIQEIQEDTNYIEGQLKEILIHMVAHLQNKQMLSEDKTNIQALVVHIEEAIDKAFENIGNTSNELAKYYVEYLNMRKNQCVVITHFYRVFLRIDTNGEEIEEVTEIILQMANSIHQTVGIKEIVEELEGMIAKGKRQGIPTTQEEFLRKAELFYILEELEELLRLKSEFLESMTEKERKQYWS